MSDTDRKDVLEKWAEGLAVEAFVQGYGKGWDDGCEANMQYGARARAPAGRAIRDNEYPYTPIAGNEMDRAPALVQDIRALREALREMVRGAEAVDDWGDILPDAVPRARALLPEAGDDDE